LVVTAEYIQNAAWSSTPDVRVNGVQASATPIVNVEYNSTNTSGRRVLVVHAIPLTGQTGTITVSMPRYASTTQHWITVQSFIGVSSTSPVQAGAATGSSLSHSITTRFRGGIVSQTFAIAGNGTLSGYSGGNAATPGGSEMVTGTVPADANITVTATASTSGDSYRSALIMYPTQTVDSGSGAVFTRNSGGSISVSPANSMLPSNYYTSRVHTPDLQITSSGGIEVSFDGWYLVRINLSSPVLYKNELPYRYGDGPYIIYCRAGDSLNAGYTSTFTATAGDQNVFEVALMNRSLL
jgi:hypothetical protein